MHSIVVSEMTSVYTVLVLVGCHCADVQCSLLRSFIPQASGPLSHLMDLLEWKVSQESGSECKAERKQIRGRLWSHVKRVQYLT